MNMAIKTTRYDSAEHLDSDEAIAAYIDEALGSADPAHIAHALGTVARAKGMTEIARGAGWHTVRTVAGCCPRRPPAPTSPESSHDGGRLGSWSGTCDPATARDAGKGGPIGHGDGVGQGTCGSRVLRAGRGCGLQRGRQQGQTQRQPSPDPMGHAAQRGQGGRSPGTRKPRATHRTCP